MAPLAVAAGNQLGAALVLALPTWWWPGAAAPSAWVAVALLAVLCTGVAYVLFFRLIARVGAGNAVAVTFLIPAVAMAWGWFFLSETVGLSILIGCTVIVIGTALATGLWKPALLRSWPLPP